MIMLIIGKETWQEEVQKIVTAIAPFAMHLRKTMFNDGHTYWGIVNTVSK